MKDIYEEYLSEQQVAEFLGISVKTLKNRIAARKNHPPVIKGVNKFRRHAFDQWLREFETSQLNKVKT